MRWDEGAHVVRLAAGAKIPAGEFGEAGRRAESIQQVSNIARNRQSRPPRANSIEERTKGPLLIEGITLGNLMPKVPARSPLRPAVPELDWTGSRTRNPPDDVAPVG